MSAPAWPLLAVPGLAAGIAARSVVWYLAIDKPPRRACPACGARPRRVFLPVRAFTGRCPHCGDAVAPPLLVPESLAAAGFALAGWLGAGGLRVAAVCWLLLFALPAVLVDAQVQRLPEVLTWPCLVVVAALSLGQAAADHSATSAIRAVLAGAAVTVFFRVLVLAGLGFGDVTFAPSLGVTLGYYSWNAAVAGIAAGFCLAGIRVAVTIAVHRRGPTGYVSFGPAMLAGAMLALWLTAR